MQKSISLALNGQQPSRASPCGNCTFTQTFAAPALECSNGDPNSALKSNIPKKDEHFDAFPWVQWWAGSTFSPSPWNFMDYTGKDLPCNDPPCKYYNGHFAAFYTRNTSSSFHVPRQNASLLLNGTVTCYLGNMDPQTSLQHNDDHPHKQKRKLHCSE